MGTVNDGVNCWDVKFLNRYNRVSFDFAEPRNEKRSETIAKRSKTPLKKSNSLMVLRTVDTFAVSAAPSSIDAASTDDVTSSCCSIDGSPVPTDSSSTGKGRRRCLPSLPTQETRQRINGAGVSAGGAKVNGLQRKHSCAWPWSSGAVNHRLIDGVNHHRSVERLSYHRSIDGVSNHRLVERVNHHRSIDGVNHHRSIDVVDHRGNDVLGGCSNNGVSRLPSESINLSGNRVDLYRSDIVSHRTNEFVNHHKSDFTKHHPSDSVTQSPTVSSNRHLNGAASNCPSNDVSVHDQSRSVNQSQSDNHNFHNNLNSTRNDSVGHHKSEMVIHLQRQSDTKLKDREISHLSNHSDIKLNDAGISHLQDQSDIELKNTGINDTQGQSDDKLKDAGINDTQGQSDDKLNDSSISHRVMKTCNTSHNIPQRHSHSINHFEGLDVNLKTSKDESLQRWLSNDYQNDVIDKSQSIVRDSSDIYSNRQNDTNVISHDSGSQRGIASNHQNVVRSLSQREKLNPRNTASGIHSFGDKLNHCRNDKNLENKSVPSVSIDYVVHRQKHHKQKLHASTSLDEYFSPAKRELQVFGGVGQRTASMDPKYGAQSKAPNSNNIASMEATPGANAKQERSPAFLQRQTSLQGSYFDASSSINDHEDDHEVNNINWSLKQDNTLQRHGRDPRKIDQDASDRHGSLNSLISRSQEKSNNSQTFSEACQPSVHSPADNSSTLPSSHSTTNTESQRRVLERHGIHSPIQIAATSRKHPPLTSTKKVSEDNHRSPGVSEINWTSSEATDLISLHDSPNPDCSTTTRRETPIVPPCVPTLHALLQTHLMTAVSLVRSTPTDDCGVKLTSVPFVADTIGSRRPAGLAPKGRRATKMGSPDGAFRPVAAVETSPGRDVQPQVVIVGGVEDGSVADAGGNIEEGDVVVEVNGTYVLGSTVDVIERLLNINQQHLNLVLAKPIGTASPKPVNGWLSKTDEGVHGIPPRTVQHLQDDDLPSVTPDQEHPILEHVQRNGQTSSVNSNYRRRQKTVAVRPTTLASSSKWSSESAYTIRPIQADSAMKTTVGGGFSEPDEAYYPSSDSCDEVQDSDDRWQKISAV